MLGIPREDPRDKFGSRKVKARHAQLSGANFHVRLVKRLGPPDRRLEDRNASIDGDVECAVVDEHDEVQLVIAFKTQQLDGVIVFQHVGSIIGSVWTVTEAFLPALQTPQL